MRLNTTILHELNRMLNSKWLWIMVLLIVFGLCLMCVLRTPRESFAISAIDVTASASEVMASTDESFTSENVPELVHLGAYFKQGMSREFQLARKSDGTLVSIIKFEDGSVILTREHSLDDFEAA